MKFEEGFRVELLWIQSIRFLPDLSQLINTPLSVKNSESDHSSPPHFVTNANMDVLYRSIDFGVLAVFLFQLLDPFLLFLPLLLVQTLQVLPPLVLLQHLVAFELLVSLCVVVLQVLGGLGGQTKQPP